MFPVFSLAEKMDLVRKQLKSMKVSEEAKIVEHVDPTMEESPDMEVHDGEEEAVCLPAKHNRPIVILLLGLAGSGKTSLCQRLCAYILSIKKRPYIVNLDPACKDPPFPVRIGKSD
jgi:signal recognition particle GTPase